MSIEEKIKFVMETLQDIYCNNCLHQHNDPDDRCDDCHRKYMGWSISKETAKKIVSKLTDSK